MSAPVCEFCVPAAAGGAAPLRTETWPQFYDRLFDTQHFPARWYCGSWTEGLGWMHVVSDVAIFLAYMAIPLGLIGVMAWRAKGETGTVSERFRKAVPFPALTLAFAVFVLCCGVGHLIEAAIFWHPVYRFAGVWKAITAIVSVGTAVALLKAAPKLLRLPDAARLSEERAALVEELATKERFLRDVIDASPTALSWKDCGGRYVGCNAKFAEGVGKASPEEVVGLTDADLDYPPEDAAAYEARNRAVCETGVAQLDAEETVTVGGRRRESLSSRVPIHHPDGRVRGVLGVFVDITKQKADERRLQRTVETLAERQTEVERLSLVANATRNGVVIADCFGTVEWVNDAYLATHGGSRDDVVGRPLMDVLGGTHAESEVRESMRRAIGRGEPVDVEVVTELRDGTACPVRAEIEPVFGGGGDLTNFVAIQTDLREQKDYEHALRTAKDAAEASDHAKSAFLAHMSHEIRTPLNGILGFADVLRGGGVPQAEADDYLDTIRSSGDHLLRLIDDILDLSKIEAGAMEFREEECNPHAVITDVFSTLRRAAKAKGLSLEFRWVGSVPTRITTDAHRLRQLITNLVNNAVKFTREGFVRLLATVEHGDRPEDTRLAIEVHDTGEGIPQDKLDVIFEPFAQADSSVTRKHGGSGLGLAITRRIAESLGGSLTVTSRVGWGSVFRATVRTGDLTGVEMFETPLYEAVRPERATLADPAEAIWQTPQDLRGLRVLVVEDGDHNRKLLRTILRHASVEVHEAADGREGVDRALAAESPYDAILLDMQMPVLDGYGAAAELRAAGCESPIIALTAHAMAGDREKCLDAGCDDYITKPVRPSDLLKTLCGALPDPPAAAEEDEADEEFEQEFRRIADDFAAELPSRVEAVRRAVAERDWAVVGRATHALNGTAGMLGFGVVSTAARELQVLAAADEPNADDAELLVTALEAAVAAVPADSEAVTAAGS